MRENSTIAMFYLSILAVIFAVGILVFLFKVIENKNAHTSKVLATLSEKMTEKENITGLSKKIAEIQNTQKKVKAYLVDPNQVDTFVEYLEKIGSDTDTELSVKTINTLESVPDKIFINISVRGAFANVMWALAVLENAPYQVNITRAYLNKELTQAPPVMQDAKGKPKASVPVPSAWRADIDFNILSS